MKAFTKSDFEKFVDQLSREEQTFQRSLHDLGASLLTEFEDWMREQRRITLVLPVHAERTRVCDVNRLALFDCVSNEVAQKCATHINTLSDDALQAYVRKLFQGDCPVIVVRSNKPNLEIK